MKKIICGFLVIMSVIFTMVPVFAEEASLILPSPTTGEIKVQLNGGIIDFKDQAGNVVNPKLINDRTMVPMRKIFEVLGSKVEWEEETQSITAVKDNLEIKLQIDNEKASIKNESGEITEIILDSVPVIVEDRTLVPVRFIAESLNKKVDWDEANQTVIIIDADFISSTIKEKAPTLYHYLENNNTAIDAYTAKGNISGKLKYTDEESKSNTSTLTLTGKYQADISNLMMAVEAELNITGKGALKDAIDDADLGSISAKIIFDGENGSFLVSGSMFDEEYKNKWIKYVLSAPEQEEYKAQMALIDFNKEKNAIVMLDGMLQNAQGLTVESYGIMEEMLDIFCDLLGDKHFTVKSDKNTDTYTLTLTLKDILKSAKVPEEEMKSFETAMQFTIESTIVSEDHIPSKTTSDITFSYTQEDEEVSGNVKLEESISNINQKVEIKLPDEKDVVEQKI